VLAGVIWLVAAPASLFAQNNPNGGEPIVIGQRRTLYSEVLNEDRPLRVYTPVGYRQSTDAFPVFYLLDGHEERYHYTTGVVQFLAGVGLIPQMIVVAIPNTPGNRFRDLLPPVSAAHAAQGYRAGAGDNFLRFIRQELLPWVEREYRTQPYRVLSGHSAGGLFAIHTLVTHPETFNAYLAISPALNRPELHLTGPDGSPAMAMIHRGESLFEDHPDLKASLYMTTANESVTLRAGAYGFARVLASTSPDSFDWEWTRMDAEDHSSVVGRSTYDGLEWIFRGWDALGLVQRAVAEVAAGGDGLRVVKDHFAELSGRLGHTVPPHVWVLSQMGDALLEQKRIDDALRAFMLNVDGHPDSAYAHHSFGHGLAAACRREEAREEYGRAHELDPNEPHFRELFDQISEEIERGVACAVVS
jgi:tetratricopeptide (TPR) repeat protein